MLRIMLHTVYPLTWKSRTELRNKDEIITKITKYIYRDNINNWKL
jgi:hypothetical protein